ncbi:MAG: hypothetical protein J5J06_15875 [Phycisphaerae bacterium]|nr:hypothetical protein [Phycisphaerae bacterium]
MSLTIRKLAVAVFITVVLMLANAAVITRWLQEAGIVPWAQHIREAYFPGPTLTIVVTLLILLPSGAVAAIRVRRCSVCDCIMFRRGRYCSQCGSRINMSDCPPSTDK